ncbi:hypothetical protein MPTK1_6g20480 [Marchantia polymorpha subsp. ruderalis]|uniref:N-acetyltransferase domain-containing protein n=2 Tax=Marchantia polymorpha TaxID=3197 RepID=A0AAF6BU66_MARPO|nr:hypothetical protein MARPO_0045s0016 [Marchantia polymorpha]BBN15550.1 hypothetical protein Mp_6g20480 [Marchantia polymorpha subsp. ruderalis]|eukprot:PTQ39339.1 hypothetical protein MARPO_0045s0016 [Marchantia polymorpha]
MSYSCIEVECNKHPLFEHCKRIRLEVFVGEQGVDADAELDDIDDYAQHFLITWRGDEGGKAVPVATMRIFHYEVPEQPEKLILKVGRIAVSQSFRAQGIGRRLMDAAEQYAKSQGRKDKKSGAFLFMHSQSDKQGFYKKCGYCVVRSAAQLDGLIDARTLREPDEAELKSLEFLEDGILHVKMAKFVPC